MGKQQIPGQEFFCFRKAVAFNKKKYYNADIKFYISVINIKTRKTKTGAIYDKEKNTYSERNASSEKTGTKIS